MTTPSSQRSFAAKDKSEASVKLIQCQDKEMVRAFTPSQPARGIVLC
jgi:hypothetical protein